MKIMKGNLEKKQCSYDFPKSCNEIVDFFQVQIKMKKLDFQMVINESVPHQLYGDKMKY